MKDKVFWTLMIIDGILVYLWFKFLDKIQKY
ncbi:MAG: Uncharacterized protein XD49_0539 [Caldanaerobacter subterraneus]|jgi:hypothetical protein|uniref:Uncharacterized protein n=2 Tax=Caldanaerobacter subterraneus TaxID=911092 RepID=U5CMC7_CALSX|nr:hypothetical protein O163_13185 [Caldanaerobacter subterraneus subsp. yonseiensis KB-1]KUK09440.1 MAG: Uncharacterized protein XD49_0539 [Caldanaerobacter subterraneus]MCS3915248.1 hypothetical protein [Caldanaerobacter subterraneus subsp. tengcongensis MB4]MDI3518412.1 hypothetical protein [Caldanaerobacter sp.]MDK2793659.1 hypothetical protein [Caldanaerobacter sp.]